MKKFFLTALCAGLVFAGKATDFSSAAYDRLAASARESFAGGNFARCDRENSRMWAMYDAYNAPREFDGRESADIERAVRVLERGLDDEASIDAANDLLKMAKMLRVRAEKGAADFAGLKALVDALFEKMKNPGLASSPITSRIGEALEIISCYRPDLIVDKRIDQYFLRGLIFDKSALSGRAFSILANLAPIKPGYAARLCDYVCSPGRDASSGLSILKRLIELGFGNKDLFEVVLNLLEAEHGRYALQVDLRLTVIVAQAEPSLADRCADIVVRKANPLSDLPPSFGLWGDAAEGAFDLLALFASKFGSEAAHKKLDFYARQMTKKDWGFYMEPIQKKYGLTIALSCA